MNQFSLKKVIQAMGIGSLILCSVVVVGCLAIILFEMLNNGLGALSTNFLTGFPKKGMTSGGILPTIVGTISVTLVTALFSIPFGIACAVYLNEYARDNWFNRLIRAAIRNLAGVPSIIYGLFGVALFVQGLQLGTSIMSAGMTLGLLTLPYIITTTEEALKNVPNSLREGALALGATRWETIRKVVLPTAMSGIMTGSILGLSRAAGETAPILFTGVAFYLRYLPSSPFDEFMALPYHVYILSTQHHSIEAVRPLAYGTALVLIAVVFLMNLTAFIVRARYRSKLS